MPDVNTVQSTTVVEATRIVRLSYLQTIAALDNQTLLGQVAGETQGKSNNFQSSDPGSPGFFGLMGEGASSVSSQFTDTGWSISRTWLETYWDKIRWAIGLRSIGIYAYNYAESSEGVSVTYKSPKEIQKISLSVDEQIPSNYPLTQRWIQYFISVDNGGTWHRINPLDHPTLYSGENGRPVPRILNFNSDGLNSSSDENKFVRTASPATEFRVRWVLLRPIGSEFNQTSPILKSYRTKIYPREGL